MSLVTRCPKCDSGFAVTADLLKQHDGLVRCGQCSHVFDGFACLQNNLPTLTERAGDDQVDPSPTTSPTTSPVPEEESPPRQPQVFRSRAVAEQRLNEPTLQPSLEPSLAPRGTATGTATPAPIPATTTLRPTPTPTSARPEPGFRRPSSPSEPMPAATVLREPSLGSQASVPRPGVTVFGETRLRGGDPSASGRTVPDFMVQDEPQASTPVLLWLGGLIVLLVILVGQLVFIYRDDLASSVPALRPALEQVCGPLNCEVGYTKRIERIFVVGSSLQLAPAQPPIAASNADSNAVTEYNYLLRLTLQNRYSQAQPWPNLMVALSDPSGTVVIRKAVAPSEYLPASLLEEPFGAQQEVSLEVRLRVDGSPVSGFEIDKFFP